MYSTGSAPHISRKRPNERGQTLPTSNDGVRDSTPFRSNSYDGSFGGETPLDHQFKGRSLWTGHEESQRFFGESHSLQSPVSPPPFKPGVYEITNVLTESNVAVDSNTQAVVGSNPDGRETQQVSANLDPWGKSWLTAE